MATADGKEFELLQGEVQQLRADFAKLGQTLQDIARHGAADTMGKAQEAAGQAWNAAKNRADNVAREIEDKPLSSALMALGVGVILGLLFGHRRA